MDIMLDANVFYKDPNLEGETFALFRKYIDLSNSRVIVPKVVLDEVAIKFRERLEQASANADSAIKEVHKLTGRTSKIPCPDVDAELSQYEARLLNKLDHMKAVVLPYPKASHSELVLRDLRRRKPFNTNGKGYRDALIWISLLKRLKGRRRDCVFVSSNSKDFCAAPHDAKRPSLHGDLVSDLGSHNYRGTMTVCLTLDEFVQKFVKPMLKKLEGLKEDFQDGRIYDFKRFFIGEFSNVLAGIENAGLDIDLPGIYLEEPYGVTSLGEPEDVEVLEVLELSRTRVHVDLKVTYDAIVYAFISKIEAYGLPDDGIVSVSDWEWNDHYAEVEAGVDIELRIGLTFDRKRTTVVNFEVLSADAGGADIDL